MRIVVDVNHPAHVHFFKNFIWEMEKRGHEVLITATEKDVAFKLLESYGFDYINLGSYGNSLVQKLINLPIIDLKMYKALRSFKPDIFVGLGSIRAAHVSFLLRKKCILFDDTEHSTEQYILYAPFVDVVCTPSCFKKELGKKQIRYDGYHELAYLHPNYFKPNPEVLEEVGIGNDETFIILRFVSWGASHDIGHYGIQNKIEFVKELENYGRVLITSEGDLDPELEKYRIKVSPEKLHNLLYYASLFIGESPTMTTESAILGTPAVCISSWACESGNFYDLSSNYGLIYCYRDEKKAICKAIDLLKSSRKKEWEGKKEKLLKEKIDVTAFMVEFIEDYFTNK